MSEYTVLVVHLFVGLRDDGLALEASYRQRYHRYSEFQKPNSVSLASVCIRYNTESVQNCVCVKLVWPHDE